MKQVAKASLNILMLLTVPIWGGVLLFAVAVVNLVEDKTFRKKILTGKEFLIGPL